MQRGPCRQLPGAAAGGRRPRCHCRGDACRQGGGLFLEISEAVQCLPAERINVELRGWQVESARGSVRRASAGAGGREHVEPLS